MTEAAYEAGEDIIVGDMIHASAERIPAVVSRALGRGRFFGRFFDMEEVCC